MITRREASRVDLIDRQAAIDHFRLIIDATNTDSRYNMGFVDGLEFCISHLSTMPSAQPEQKIGKFVRWIEKRETPDYISYTPHCKCSLCGNELLIESINYCYMCGASLIEDREAERKEE